MTNKNNMITRVVKVYWKKTRWFAHVLSMARTNAGQCLFDAGFALLMRLFSLLFYVKSVLHQEDFLTGINCACVDLDVLC